MHERDTILLAAFDDEAQPSGPAAPGPRPASRSRPDPSSHPPTDPITLVVLDSGADAEPTVPPEAVRKRPTLPFDLGLFDGKRGTYLLVYSSGTPLELLKPRIVSVPSVETGPPITEIVVYARSGTEADPVPYLTFQFPHDIQGQLLTFRFTDPADVRSLRIECDPRKWIALPGLALPDSNASVPE